MPAISYTKARSGDLLVKVPYDMKDLFKKSFRGMKWMSDQKLWKLPASREKRLKSWIDTVNAEAGELEDQLEARDQVEMTEKEIDELRCDLQQLQRQLGGLQEKQERLEELAIERREILVKLDALKPQVQAARADKESAQAEADAEAERLRKILEDVCDINKIFTARDEMSSVISRRRPLLSRDKSTYREAQSAVEEEHDRLKAIGWGSRGLHRLENMNPNRPDRDHPGEIGLDEILDLVELEPENPAPAP